MSSKSEVVISGIGGIFPKCVNFDDYMDLLIQNKTTAEKAKWVEEQEGTIYNHFPDKKQDQFDASFFGVHATQAAYFDPLTRLMMETTFEAIIDAGLNPVEISERTIPVIFASAVCESVAHLWSDPHSPGFAISGHARCMAANRVSFYLNLKGPSIYLDENWTGPIEAIKIAIDMIENGECGAAIIGAGSLGIEAAIEDLMNERGLICKDGKTKPFTQQADGYSRGDALVVLFLQRASDAKRNYASILYANTRFNGNYENGVTGFDVDFLEKFLQDCYNQSGVDPKTVTYLEAEGCGLKNLDEIELAAVERIFCKNREFPLLIGSVKTNIGHTQSTSALTSLIKIIIAMETGILPAHLNFDLKDTKIPALVSGKLEVVTKNREWTGEIAAINCFGLSSTYGHIIVRRSKQKKSNPVTNLPIFLYYSTRTEEGIIKINEKVAEQLPDFDYMKLVQDVFSKIISGHLYRGYTVKSLENSQGLKFYSGMKPPVWFVYSGMGSQWKTMGRDLMKIPVFSASINKCHNILESKGVDLLRIITDDDPQIFENILNSFVGIAAIQIGLTDLLEMIGVVPDGLIGHSVGELGCAYADKCLTAEQMILCAYYRGKASLDAKLIVGLMAAVGLGHSAIRDMCPDSVEVACHNSADSCTISGPAEDVKDFVEILKSKGLFARLVNVANIAYHSKYIKPAAPLLLSYLENIIPHPKERSKKWICTSLSQNLWETDLAKKVSPEYLTNNLLSSVLFEEGLPFVPDNAVLIEIAPHGLLQAILRQALPKEVINISLTKRETNGLEFLFSSLGGLYINGVDFNASNLYPETPVPVSRGTRSLCSLIQWEHKYEWMTNISGSKYAVWEKTFCINTDEIFNLDKNTINKRIIVPFSILFGYITDSLQRKDDVIRMIIMEDIIFKNQLEITPGEPVTVSFMYQPGSGYSELSLVDKLILSGTIIINDDKGITPTNVEKFEEIFDIKAHNFYKILSMNEHNYPEENKLVSKVTSHKRGLNATIRYTKDIKAFLSSALQIHLFHKIENQIYQKIFLPKYIRQIYVKIEDFENTAQDYSIWYNNITDIIHTDCGIQITGIEYEEIPSNNIALKVENLRFVAHFGEHIQDIRVGLDMLLKIVMESSNDSLVIVELKEKNCSEYSTYIEKYLRMKNVNIRTSEINDISSLRMEESLLIITSGQFLDILPEILPEVNSYFLFCLRKNQSVDISKKYITVAHFCTEDNQFFLVKQINVTPIEVVNIKDDKLSHESMQTYPWTTDLETAVNDGKKIYITCRFLPEEGIDDFIEKMREISNGTQEFRYLFLLDPRAPECRADSEFYASVFEQDLFIQVLQDGSWGSFIDMSEISEETFHSNILSCAVESSNLLRICKPIHFGLHLSDLTRTNSNSIPNEIGALDFSGTYEKKEQIMGFGQFDVERRSLTIDQEFVWPVPMNWTLDDAATVPYAYTLGYYSLFIVADPHPDDIVLIHGGTSEIGLAALYLARSSGHRVYTTVETDTQRIFLRDVFELPDNNILDSSTMNYVKKISLITSGNGVQIILNCLPGKENIEACKSLLAAHGRIVQLATSALKQYNTTGMFIFNKGTAFISVSGQELLQLPQDIKHQLQEMVTDGLKNGHIQPLSRKIFDENELDEGLRFLRRNCSIGAVLVQLNLNSELPDEIKNSSRTVHSQGSYFIYADSSDAWIFLANWLVNNGAKRIVVASLSNQDPDFLKWYISMIKETYYAEIIVSQYDATTSENTKKIFNDIGTFSPLYKTFILAMSEDKDKYKKIVGHIYDFLYQTRSQGKMIIFVGENRENYCTKKNDLNICNIAWTSGCHFQDVIKNLEMILEKNVTNIYLKDDSKHKRNEVEHSITEDYSSFLPSSLNVLKQLSHSDLISPKIVKLSYESKTQDDSSPLFIVPDSSGPYSTSLRKFADEMLYPVFCVSLPATRIKDDMVESLAQQFISIGSPKVYKLVGISLGAILILEIAKKLESLGKRVEVYLIDGVPQMIKKFTNLFHVNEEFDSTLLKELVKIDGQNLKDILSAPDLSKVDYKDIVRSLTVLENHIEYLNFYKPLENRIRGLVTMILSKSTLQEDFNLSEHCEQFRLKVINVDKQNILQSENLIEYLHKSIDIIFV